MRLAPTVIPCSKSHIFCVLPIQPLNDTQTHIESNSDSLTPEMIAPPGQIKYITAPRPITAIRLRCTSSTRPEGTSWSVAMETALRPRQSLYGSERRWAVTQERSILELPCCATSCFASYDTGVFENHSTPSEFSNFNVFCFSGIIKTCSIPCVPFQWTTQHVTYSAIAKLYLNSSCYF